VIAISNETPPVGIGLAAVLVAVLIGVAVPDCPPVGSLTTYAVFQSGVIAIPTGAGRTWIGLPAFLVAVLIGTTVLRPVVAT
jgi:hypothetical protein